MPEIDVPGAASRRLSIQVGKETRPSKAQGGQGWEEAGGREGAGMGRGTGRPWALQGRNVSSFLPSPYVWVQPDADRLPSAVSG